MQTGDRSRVQQVVGGTALVAAGATFVVLFGQIAKSSRLPPDDLCALAAVRLRGVLGMQLQLFQTWSGRWASNLFITLIMARGPRSLSLHAYALLLLAFVVATAWTSVRAVTVRRVPVGVCGLLGLVTVALLFFATPNRGDSWFFAGSSVENLVPICFGWLALACVLRSAAHRRLVLPGALAAALAAGGHECVSLTWLSTGYALLLWFVVRAHVGAPAAAPVPRGDPRLAAGAIVLAVATASFVVCAASPGASMRAAILGHVAPRMAIVRALSGGPQLVCQLASEFLPSLAATVLAWAWAANRFAVLPASPSPRAVVGVALALVGLALVAGFATALPGYYALDDAPPTRAQIALAVFLVAAAAIVGAQLGSASRRLAWAGPLLLVAMLAVLGGVFQRERARLIPDIAAARFYARAYDARVAALLVASRPRPASPVIVAALPPSGLLRSAEISADDPRAYPNHCLATAVRLHAAVLRAPEPPG